MSKPGCRGWVSEWVSDIIILLFVLGMIMHNNVWNKGINTWTNNKTYAFTNLHSFRGCLYCQCFTNELLTNLQKKKTKKKSAIQKEAHMHTKSFVVVRFCFVRPPGLELNLTSSAFLGTLSFLLVLINDFVRGCEWVLKVTRPRPPDRTLFEPWALITPSFPWPLWGLINSVRSLYSFSAVKRMS